MSNFDQRIARIKAMEKQYMEKSKKKLMIMQLIVTVLVCGVFFYVYPYITKNPIGASAEYQRDFIIHLLILVVSVIIAILWIAAVYNQDAAKLEYYRNKIDTLRTKREESMEAEDRLNREIARVDQEMLNKEVEDCKSFEEILSEYEIKNRENSKQTWMKLPFIIAGDKEVQ